MSAELLQLIAERDNKTIGRVRRCRGHRVFELDVKALEFEEVMPVQQIVTVKEGHLYCAAINRTTAEKKFIRMLEKLTANAG